MTLGENTWYLRKSAQRIKPFLWRYRMDGEAVKEPSELSEEEQEARQTGEKLEDVVAKKKAKKAKPAKAKAKVATAKKPVAPKKKPAAGETKEGKKAKRPGALGKTGPKGNKKPVRNALDGGKFGLQVARARKAKGWTQGELAEKVGMTQPAICNIEKGTCGCSEDLGKKIAGKLGISAPKPRKEAA